MSHAIYYHMATKWVQKWLVHSRSSENVYTVSRDANNNFGCSCPAWKFQRKQCAHIDEVVSVIWPQEHCSKILELTENIFKALSHVATDQLKDYLNTLPLSHQKQFKKHVALAKIAMIKPGFTHYRRFSIDYHDLVGLPWLHSFSPSLFISLDFKSDTNTVLPGVVVKQPIDQQSVKTIGQAQYLLESLRKTVYVVLPNIKQILDFYFNHHINLLCVTPAPFSENIPEEMKSAWEASSLTQVYKGLVQKLPEQLDPAKQILDILSIEDCVNVLHKHLANEFGDTYHSAYMATHLEKVALLSRQP